jgi:histidinol-phosphate aminotransferase
MNNEVNELTMITNLLRQKIKTLKPYSSARNEFEGNASIWLDANESPTSLPGLPDGINRYPATRLKDLKSKIASIKGVDISQTFVGNGSDEAVDLLYRIFCNPGQDKALVFPPTYGMYGVCADINDIEVIESNLDVNFKIDLKDFESKNALYPKLTFICNPNNPTGNVQDSDTIRQIIETSNGIVIVDEAYIDFCPSKSVLKWINQYPNLVVLQTLSKAWGLAGARVGLAFASSEIISVMNKVKFPYNVGQPSIDIALNALNMSNLLVDRVSEITNNRQTLTNELKQFPMVEKIYTSSSNFILTKFKNHRAVYNALASNGIVVRDRHSQSGCEGCLRITVGTREEVEKLINCLKEM